MIRTPKLDAGRKRAGLFVLLCAVLAAGAQWATPGAGASEPTRWTSATDIVARAASWVAAEVPYSQSARAPDARGKDYRTDCSGFISMAWGLDRSLTTQSLPSVATALGPVGDYTALRAGDMLDTAANRHAVLFVRWADADRTTAVVMEEPHPGGVARIDSSHYSTTLLAAEGFVAYRYDRVRTPVSMDWTGDGYPDVVAHTVADGSLWLFPGPSGARVKPRRLATGLTDVTALVELGDVDQSGDPALVVRKQDGSIWAYLRNSRDGLAKARRVSGPRMAYDSIAPAGALDPTGIVAHATNGTVWLLAGNGAGAFHSPRLLADGWATGEAVVSTGGFGKDGFPVMFGRGADGTLWQHAGNGRGGWAVPRPVVSAQTQAGLVPAAGADTASELSRLLKVDRLGSPAVGTYVSAVGERGDVFVRRADGSLLLLHADAHGGFAAPTRAGGRWLGYDLVV